MNSLLVDDLQRRRWFSHGRVAAGDGSQQSLPGRVEVVSLIGLNGEQQLVCSQLIADFGVVDNTDALLYGRLSPSHTIEQHRHAPGAGLVVGNVTPSVAVDKEFGSALVTS